ncbi:MAG TPA: UbiA family prenyltransferase [Polyangia bacterium]|nr:UbiA family prenyltransferase [Polyangia bacterium]
MPSPARALPVERSLVWAVLRAGQWVHFLALPAAGLDGALLDRPAALSLRLAASAGVAALALAYAYGLNAISDRATDLDAGKNPLAGVAGCPPSIVALMIAVGAAALIAGAALGQLVAITVSLAAATVYSIGPRLKRLPFLGTALNAAIFVPLLFLARAGGSPPAFALLVVTFALLLLQNQLLHERADAVEDSASGARTTATLLGDRATRALALVLGLAGIAASLVFAPSPGIAAIAAAVLIAASLVANGYPKSHVGKPRLDVGKPRLDIGKLRLGIGKPQLHVGEPRLHIGKLRLDREEPKMDWAQRRVLHRAVAFVGGALLYLAIRLA